MEAIEEVDPRGTILEEGDGGAIIRILIKATATRVMKSGVMGILEVEEVAEVVINNNHSLTDIIQAQEDRATTTNNNRCPPIIIMEDIPKGEKETIVIVTINAEMEEVVELVNKATSLLDITPDSENFCIKTSSTLH